MCWIMTVKDHATGFVFICALPCKEANFVAYKLQEFFGVIGYPIIFHTDNGKEFTAKVILCFLCQLNPNIITVTGLPCHPNNHGSVESMNKLVKRVLNCTLTERRLVREIPNWTEVLGSVDASINAATGCGNNETPAYTAVYIGILSAGGMILSSLLGFAHCCTMMPTWMCHQDHHIQMTIKSLWCIVPIQLQKSWKCSHIPLIALTLCLLS